MDYRHDLNQPPRHVAKDHVIDLSQDCSNPTTLHLHDKIHEYPIELKVACSKRFKCLCPSCSDKWRKRTFYRYLRAISNFKTPKFLTLTLKYDVPSGKCDRVKLLWKYRNELFKKLRAPRLLPVGSKVMPGYKIKKSGRVWRPGYKIKAWAAVLELPNHVHIVFDGSYIPQEEIQSLWLDITSDSWFVNIKPVRADCGPRIISSYLTKYITKMADYTLEEISELESFHMVQTHGLDFGKKLPFLVDFYGIYGIGSRGWRSSSRQEFLDSKQHWKNDRIWRYLRSWQQRDLDGYRLTKR